MADAAVVQVIDKAATRHGEGQFVVVFVHGFLDDRHTWDAVVSHLDAPGFESVQIDLAGSGARADVEGPFDYDRFATDVGAVVDHIGKPFVVASPCRTGPGCARTRRGRCPGRPWRYRSGRAVPASSACGRASGR